MCVNHRCMAPYIESDRKIELSLKNGEKQQESKNAYFGCDRMGKFEHRITFYNFERIFVDRNNEWQVEFYT